MTTQIRSPEQSRAEYVRVMGKDLGLVYHAIWQQVAWLNCKWAEYVVLFGTKQSRVELLNNTAPLFGRIIQDSLWEDVLLHIARLTDPPRSVGRQNLTILSMPPLVADSTARRTLDLKITEARVASEFCRDWRNRHIAHRDLHLALSLEAKPLKEASREKVADALGTLSSVVNVVSQHYHDSTSFFDMGPDCRGATALLRALDDGQRIKQARLERIKNGQHEFDDLSPRDL